MRNYLESSKGKPIDIRDFSDNIVSNLAFCCLIGMKVFFHLKNHWCKDFRRTSWRSWRVCEMCSWLGTQWNQTWSYRLPKNSITRWLALSVIITTCFSDSKLPEITTSSWKFSRCCYEFSRWGKRAALVVIWRVKWVIWTYFPSLLKMQCKEKTSSRMINWDAKIKLITWWVYVVFYSHFSLWNSAWSSYEYCKSIYLAFYSLAFI